MSSLCPTNIDYQWKGNLGKILNFYPPLISNHGDLSNELGKHKSSEMSLWSDSQIRRAVAFQVGQGATPPPKKWWVFFGFLDTSPFIHLLKVIVTDSHDARSLQSTAGCFRSAGRFLWLTFKRILFQILRKILIWPYTCLFLHLLKSTNQITSMYKCPVWEVYSKPLLYGWVQPSLFDFWFLIFFFFPLEVRVQFHLPTCFFLSSR